MDELKSTGSFKTPILFVIFNRPDKTQVVFEAIRKAKPPRLYVAADGPRENRPDDEEKSKLTREIASQVDWDCELITLFQPKNLGCKVAVSSAINWFFANEEEGIILEDDCLPDPSFFWYCQELLEKYRHNSSVMHISGSNFQYGWQRDKDYSYYFSSYPHEWAWASWRRAWNLYEVELTKYPEITAKGYLKGYYTSELERKYRLMKYINSVTWDYQWNFAVNIHNGLAIIPNVNMVKNIGFGGESTHTLSQVDKRATNPVTPMSFPIKHPPFIIRDLESDKRYFNALFFQILKRKAFSLLGIKGYDFHG